MRIRNDPVPTISELSGELDDFYKACRREAMDAAKEFQSMRAMFTTESEWAEYWLNHSRTDDPCTLQRANLLIRCAENFGDKPIDDWTPAEIEELDHAFWRE